jgi:cell division protein FtsN
VKPVTAEPVPEPSKPAAAEPKKPAAAEPKTPAAPEHKKPAAAEPKKSATAETKKPPAEKGKPWFVQLGVFTKRENADQLVRQVAAKGQSAHASGSPPTVRVRIGPLPDKAAAQALKKRLGVEGFSATIVAP